MKTVNEVVKWLLALFAALVLAAIVFFGIGLVIVYEFADMSWSILMTLGLILVLTLIFRFTACRNVQFKRFLWWKA